MAALTAEYTVAHILIRVGADLAATDECGRAALHIAARRGLATGVVRLLVDASADISATDTGGTTPPGMAFDPDTRRLLIGTGAE